MFQLRPLEASLVDNLKKQIGCLQAQVVCLKRRYAMKESALEQTVLRSTSCQASASVILADVERAFDAVIVQAPTEAKAGPQDVPPTYQAEMASLQFNMERTLVDCAALGELYRHTAQAKEEMAGEVTQLRAALRRAEATLQVAIEEKRVAVESLSREQSKRLAAEAKRNGEDAKDLAPASPQLLNALHQKDFYKLQTERLAVEEGQDETIAEMATLAVSCVRIFLRAQQHPYEGAYFNFVYQCNSQYRCSIYLPLPERFGVRGGLAMASTPPRAQQLCALHAIEVLCTLNCVPASCRRLEKWQRLLSLREKMGLSVPDEVGVSSPDARSPPSYREVSGPACTTLPSPSDIWRVMRIDADTFDVCPIAFLSSLSEGKTGICWHTATRDMVLASLAYHAGWSEDDLWRHTHHYCGLQNFRGKPRPSANTFWVELPLDPKTYGRRVACGRCVTRAGAIRHLYIHILRTLHALRACPWEVLAERELLTTIYKGNWARMKLHMAHWPGLRDNVLAIRPADERAAVDAEVVSCNYAEALSPHPVMSDKLARLTFTF